MSKQQIEQHALSGPIYDVLSVNGISDPREVTDTLLKLLDHHGIIEYGNSSPALLTNYGRVLSSIALRPNISVSELQMVLGSGASTVTHAITTLFEGKFITRTKVGRKNHYEIVTEVTKNHGDIRRLIGLMEVIESQEQKEGDDSTSLI